MMLSGKNHILRAGLFCQPGPLRRRISSGLKTWKHGGLIFIGRHMRIALHPFRTARKLFIASLVYLPVVLTVMLIDRA